MNIAVTNLQSKIPVPFLKINTAVPKVCKLLRLKHQEISVVFVGDRRMRSLNKNFLGHDYVTDVITFDLEVSGEIIICPQVASQNAKTQGQSLNKEILLYVIHGLLHLAGYDDHHSKDIKIMRQQEQVLLKKIL